MNPLVSVIVPAYNAERWIAHALSSVAGQTWEELEIVVVDDGSDDGTTGVVGAFADPRVRLVTQERRGAAAARNRGIRETRGTLIQFLDADDVLSPEKIERQVRALQSEPRDSLASCAWGRFSAGPETAHVRPEPVWTVSDPAEWLVTSLSGGGMMQPGAWLTPRALVDAAGPWDETLSLHDDGEFFSRVLLRASRNVFVSGATAYYRDLEGSLSRRRSRQAIESALAVCRLRERHLRAVRDDRAVRRALATQYAQFAYEFADAAPDLASQAIEAIRELGEKPARRVGGKLFRLAAATLGLDVALRLRSFRLAT
jgi:glycosyltransferase involved in cell wall biosynthesis